MDMEAYAIGNDVGMTVETSFWVAVFSTFFAGEVPDDEGLVSAAGEQHVWAFQLLSAYRAKD